MRTNEFENFYDHELDIYFKYNILEVNKLIDILWNIESLYSKVLSITSPVYVYKEKPFRNYLEVSSIKSGSSINFKLKEGWKPEFNVDNGDLEIGIPKNLGVPAIVLFLLLTGIDKTVQIYNHALDAQIKRIELQLKENELSNKMLKTKEEKGIRSIQLQLNKTIKSFIYNPEITYFEINSIEIPTNPKQIEHPYKR